MSMAKAFLAPFFLPEKSAEIKKIPLNSAVFLCLASIGFHWWICEFRVAEGIGQRGWTTSPSASQCVPRLKTPRQFYRRPAWLNIQRASILIARIKAY
ncbi:hypothetical protein [Sphingobium xenophagum]|uniref:hypothetical protein n=1 Tax=Sphingobium xenophagum TaxID=121428 RepID=UPI001CB6B8FB|nr:hypothetical protein [Sphingobium xenophagum]